MPFFEIGHGAKRTILGSIDLGETRTPGVLRRRSCWDHSHGRNRGIIFIDSERLAETAPEITDVLLGDGH